MNEEQLRVIISAEIGKLEKALKQGKKETEDFADKGEKAGKRFSKAMEAVGKATAAAMKATAAALAAGVTAIVGIAESTEEYRTAQAKLTTAFEAAGGSAETATATYQGLQRVLGDTDVAVEAAAHLAQMTTNEQELAEWTQICQGVYATFGDSLPIEGLTEAANETAKVGQVTGSLADALNWAGISEDEFNAKLEACNSEAEREALIRTTLNGLYQEAAETYEKNAAEMLAANEAQEKLNAAMAALGKIAQPIVTLLKGGLAKALEGLIPGLEKVGEAFQDMVNGVEGGSEKMQEGIQMIVDSAMETLNSMLPMALEVGLQIIISLIQGITNAFPQIVSTLVKLFPTIVSAIVELIPQVTGALLNALPLLIDAGVQLLTGLLDGAATMIPVIIEQIIDIIPKVLDSLLGAVPQLIQATISFLMAMVQAIPKFIPQLVKALPQIIKSIINTIVDSLPLLVEGALALFFGIIDAIPLLIPELVAALPEIITAIVGGLIGAIPTILGAALQMFMAIPEALLGIFGITDENLTALGDNLNAWLSDFGTALSDWWAGAQEGFQDWWTNVADGFNDWWGGLSDGYNEWCDNTAELLGEWWSSAQEGWNDFWGGVGEKVDAGVTAVTDWFNTMKEDATAKATELQNNVANKFNAAKETMNQAISQAREYAGQKLEEMRSAYESKGGGIQGIVAGVSTGIKSLWSDACDFMNQKTNGRFGEILSSITSKLESAKSTVSNILGNIKEKFTSIFDTCKNTVKNAIDKIKSFFNFEWSLPKLKMPHLTISGSFSINPPSVPKFSISWYQLGGVFDFPTLFGYGNGRIGGLGENGAEAIVPLEKNTLWLDRIAERLYAKQGMTPIILQVDGKTFAQTSIASINQLTRQTGKLDLVLV